MHIQLSDPLNDLDRCPQCGTAKPTLKLRASVFSRYDIAEGNQIPGWAIYQCTSCKNAVMFESANIPFAVNIDHLSGAINHQYRVYTESVLPQRNHDFADWPERAANYMRQAVDVVHAPDAAVMLAGSAVDALLKAKGYEDGSVYARIEKAADDSVLTEAMSDWAHAVRLAANNPRHADLNAPHASPEEAKATIEFVKALGQFLFVLPAKVERGKASAEAAMTGDED